MTLTNRRTFCAGMASALALSAPWLHATSANLKPHRLRHYVVASNDLSATCQDLYDFLELKPTPPRQGPSPTAQFGFETSMMKIGDTMLEVVQPIQAKHRLHDWMDANGGPGGYMVVLQTFDAEALKSRAEKAQLKLTRDMVFRGQHMIQFDIAHFGTHFELYEYTPEDNWWGDPLGRNYPVSEAVAEITGCQVSVNEPEKISAQIARLFIGELDGTRVTFGDKVIEFVQADDVQRLSALEFASLKPSRRGETKIISGLELRLS